MNKKTIALFIALAFTLCACGRLPSPSRSQDLIYGHFKKYAKKYKDTVYGQQGIKKVEIDAQREIRKHFAAVDAYVTLNDGTLKKIHASLQKKSLGWRFISWEDATGL